MACPETPAEKQHKIRVLMGNGMTGAVWERVQKRFKVPQVIEFYGSTEGNIMTSESSVAVCEECEVCEVCAPAG